MSNRISWDTGVALVLSGAFVSFFLWICWGNWAPDISALYMAAHFFAEGRPELIYAAPDGFFGPDIPVEWLQVMSGFGLQEQQALPYVYPPLWAAVLAPLADGMHPVAFSNLFYLIHVPALIGTILLGYRIIAPDNISLTSWVLMSAAICWLSFIPLFALYHNQPQILVVFLIFVSMERHLSQRPFAAGCALALAAAIKVTPAAFALVFLLNRDWRALITFTAAGAGFVLVSAALAGIDLHLDYIARVAALSETIGGLNVNWTLESLLYQGQLFMTGEPHLRGENNYNVWAGVGWITFTTTTAVVALTALLI